MIIWHKKKINDFSLNRIDIKQNTSYILRINSYCNELDEKNIKRINFTEILFQIIFLNSNVYFPFLRLKLNSFLYLGLRTSSYS